MVEAAGAEPTLAMGQAGLITQGQVASGPDRRCGLSMTRATGRVYQHVLNPWTSTSKTWSAAHPRSASPRRAPAWGWSAPSPIPVPSGLGHKSDGDRVT